MRDEGDCETDQDMSLSGRISRVERILSMSGFGGIESQYEYDMLGNRSAAERQKEEAWRRDNLGRASAAQRTQPASGFEEITNRLQSSLNRLVLQAHRVEDIGRRIYGPLPDGANGEEIAQREPQGTMEHAIVMCHYLDSVIERLSGAVTRIEQV